MNRQRLSRPQATDYPRKSCSGYSQPPRLGPAPWQESFKNDGAFAETTFHILTKTGKNAPDNNLPLLTYSSPQGIYGAEPILLDFYLSNAPLRLSNTANGDNNLQDWRIRVTVNGESFHLILGNQSISRVLPRQ